MDTILNIQKLYKKMDDFTLRDISFSLEPGYIMGLVGVNGAGKTTLLNTIMNIYRKDQGNVTIGKFSMENGEKEAKDQIGFVMDENMFEDAITVEANAKLFGRLYSQYSHELFLKFCSRFEVSVHQKVGRLSTGQNIRFQFAFALSHGAKLFLMDEPSAGLDPQFRKNMLHIMQEIVRDGTRSVLFSTHITSDLDQVGDYIALIKDGSLHFFLSMEEIQDRYLLLRGSRQQIEALDCPRMIYREYGEYDNSAMIERTKNDQFGTLTCQIPNLEELMYYLEKGGYGYVKAGN